MLHSSRGGQRISALTFPLGGGFNPPSALSTTTAHQQQSEIPANLCCSHCKGIFDEPLLLSCGHSFCRRCVEPWLRQSTNCPYCRSTTLAPIRNFTLAEKVADYKRRNGKAKGEGGANFIRSFVRRSMHPSKEREALRASQRRPKNVVLPEREASAHPPNPTPPNVRQMAASLEKKIRLIGEQQKMGTTEKEGKDKMAKDGDGTFPRMGNLRRSFARIRNKMATGKQQNADEAEPIQQRKPTAIVVGVRSSNSVSALNNNQFNQFNSPTIGELMARSRTPTSMGRMDGIGFTEINLQTPGSLSRISCSTADHRRPSMGISGSALRRNNSPAEEKAPPPSPQQQQLGNGPNLNDEGGGEGNAGKGGGGPNTSAGCVLM